MCSPTVHLLDHRHFHILGVVVVGQIKVFGHVKTSSMVAGVVIISLHRPKVLTKTVRKFTAGFSDVRHVTSLAKDRMDHAGGSTIEPPFEVNTSARGSYRISLRRVGQMSIAIALLGFNDLGRSVTPTFLFRNRLYLQLSPHCSKMNKKSTWEVKKISRFLSTGHGILPSCCYKARETMVSKCERIH